jgi:hypothetical protein
MAGLSRPSRILSERSASCAEAASGRYCRAKFPTSSRRENELLWENALPHSTDNDTTRATASLPGLEIEIVHRRPRGDDGEALSIHLQATPSFEAFGRLLEASNPFAFWAQAFQQGLQMAWLPWLGASRALTLPWHTGAALQPQSEAAPKTDNISTD